MDCRAELQANILTLENSRIRREYRWNDGHLISRSLLDRVTSQEWIFAGHAPDCQLPGESPTPSDGQLDVQACAATAIAPAHLRATVTCKLGALEIRRVFRLYPDCPAIACDFYLRGSSNAAWRSAVAGIDYRNIEAQAHLTRDFHAPAIESFSLNRRHVRLRVVSFFDVTDRRNNLVRHEDFLPYTSLQGHCGNLMLGRLALEDAGFFILKEAPCFDVQLAYPGCDFLANVDELRVVGIGLDPADLKPDAWTRGYGFVTGVCGGDELSALQALRCYQENVRLRKPERDEMVLVNTWGDRGQDKHLGEAFALAELDACARLGASRFQLDDGWQKGRSSNSAFGGGTLQSIWAQKDYWDVHPERFPRGLAPVVQRGKELGVEVCVWFNPSADESYAHWEDDANVLIGLHKQHGIRTFKIDGVIIQDKAGEVRLRAMFEKIVEGTGGQAVINFDVTAGRRCGYHYMTEYGNLFLENRYTDWTNYYPHWTLRNLWMLARYVPPQNLQIECLNKWRNTEKYPPDDSLAPQKLSFEYCFAITMMAQPLCWFEASRLPPEAFQASELIKTYRRHQERIHAGQILPIGSEPSGAAWTGFQSLRGNEGYFLVFREKNPSDAGKVRVWLPPGQRVTCEPVVGNGKAFSENVDSEGRLEFRLPAPQTFALFAYRLS